MSPTSRSMFPLATFDVIDDALADRLLVEWGHWLGGCNRPFGRQSFGLDLRDAGIVSVAVSASTVNVRCGGWDRQRVIELARQCSHPAHRWATRVCIRLWRQLAPQCWTYWPAEALVSYSNSNRHTGDVYRFDGWKKVADVKGGVAGGSWSRGKVYEPKSVWVYEL